ncbi:hypothetical protein GCM10020331_076720 [Ectobacillus funiculus]
MDWRKERQESNEFEKEKNPIMIAFNGLFEAVKVKEFWLLAGSFFVCGLSTSGLIGTHFCFLLYELRSSFSYICFAAFIHGDFFDLVGTTVSGWLSDRFDNRWLLFLVL